MNASTMIMAALFLYRTPPIFEMLIGLEVSVHKLLHVRQTDFIEGHIAVFLPATMLAILLSYGVRLLPGPFATWVLQTGGGLLAVTIAPLWWLGENYAIQQQYGWNPFQAVQAYEMLAVVVLVFFYSFGGWVAPVWVVFSVVLAHSGFWIWQCGPYRVFISNWQVAPFVGLCSGLVWVVYLQQGRRTWPQEPIPAAS
jgi:hypothetical protein